METEEKMPHSGKLVSVLDPEFAAFRKRIVGENRERNLQMSSGEIKSALRENPNGKFGPKIEEIIRREMALIQKTFSDHRIFRYETKEERVNFRELDALCIENETPTLIVEIKSGVDKRRQIRAAVKHLNSLAELFPTDWNPKKLIIFVNLHENGEESKDYMPKGSKRTTFARISHINGLPKLGMVEIEFEWIKERLEAQYPEAFSKFTDGMNAANLTDNEN